MYILKHSNSNKQMPNTLFVNIKRWLVNLRQNRRSSPWGIAWRNFSTLDVLSLLPGVQKPPWGVGGWRRERSIAGGTGLFNGQEFDGDRRTVHGGLEE
jgi:hypothetical protein